MITEQRTHEGVTYSAGFGVGGRESNYRYTLRRDWSGVEPGGLLVYKHSELGPSGHECPCRDCRRIKQLNSHALFIMLNPSKADALQDDPTVAKCMRLAKRWGFGAVEVRNIFALRSTDPKALRTAQDPRGGDENDTAILDAANDPRTGLIVGAWGNHGKLFGRSNEVRYMLLGTKRPVYAFNVSQQGEPCHPLYQREQGVTPEFLARYL